MNVYSLRFLALALESLALEIEDWTFTRNRLMENSQRLYRTYMEDSIASLQYSVGKLIRSKAGMDA